MWMMRILKIHCLFIAGTALAFFVAHGFAQSPFPLEPLNPVFSDRNGLAIRGADPVAYFTQGKAVQGKEDYVHVWQGAKWLFTSAENRDAFTKAPEKYVPQYGGYCALAVAHKTIAPINPESWAIIEGKLYLNFDKPTQEQWKKDIPGNIKKADANWPGVLAE